MQDREFEKALDAISENVDAEEYDVLITEAIEKLETGEATEMDEAVVLSAVELSDNGVISEAAYNVADAVMEAYGDSRLMGALAEAVDGETFEYIVDEAAALLPEYDNSISEAVDAVLDTLDEGIRTAISNFYGGQERAAAKAAKQYYKDTVEKGKKTIEDQDKRIAAAEQSRKALRKNQANAKRKAQAMEDVYGKNHVKTNMARKDYKDFKARGDAAYAKTGALKKQAETLPERMAAKNKAAKKNLSAANRRAVVATGKGVALTAVGAGAAAGAGRAYYNYKKHGDALYDVHRLQEKRKERKALAAGVANESVDPVDEAANAMAYLTSLANGTIE